MKGLEDLQKFLETPINEEDGDQVARHLNQLASMLAFAGTVVGSCTMLYWTKKTPEHRAMNKLAERYVATISHSIDAYRSILSRLKKERELTSFHG